MDISKVNDDFQKLFQSQKTNNGPSVFCGLPDGKSRWRFVSAGYPERQHYVRDFDDDQNHFVPCPGKRSCPLCQAGLKAGFKYRFVGINKTKHPEGDFDSVEDVAVKFVAIPVGVSDTIFSVVSDGNSVIDQDFIIEKTGKGINTKYTVYPSTKNAPLSAIELKAIEEFPEPETLLRKPPTFEEFSMKSYEDPRDKKLVYHGRNSKWKNQAAMASNSASAMPQNNFTGSENKMSDTSWDDFN